uniref:Uncharacterized protein n=1 Tax=Pithovirus LCPAC406 TaxID=2506599 RepID=A0A481ZCS5_9VIRU|nr:MAG: uncharacterized protein LCPAC406_00220 [Pithovirus LCPAC406]
MKVKKEDMKILYKRSLNMNDIKRLGDEKAEELGIVDYEDNQDLNDSDFIIAAVEFRKKEYVFIHGFPGDNPVGAFLDHDWNIIIPVGEGGPFGKNVLSDWYYAATEYGRDYTDDLFQAGNS